MNAPIIDPVQWGFPEVIEEYLEHGVIKCVAFNRRGTLLAAGCSNGRVVIWDFVTRNITREFIAKDCDAAIISISWSKYGHRILVSAADKSLILWDVVKREKIAQTTLQQAAMQARLHPISSTPSLCLVCPLSSPPMIVDLIKETRKVLPVSLGNAVDPPFKPTAACFNKYGDLVYVGNSKGEILIIDHERVEILGVISIPGSPVIKNVVFSRNGQYLLANSNDKTIRIYENLLPLKDALKALNKLHQESDETEKSRVVGRRCLAFSRELQDTKSKVQWKAPCFSGNGEWVIGGLSRNREHKMYIWDRAGSVVRILEGLKEAVIDIAWHPVRPIIVSVSLVGSVYIWVKEYIPNWSAFAPSYAEHDRNVEYAEREDEFDIVPETILHQDVIDEDDIIVDIITIEKDPAFSDSDMSQGEIQYLHDDPIPEKGEEEDVGESRLSEEPGDGHLTTNDHGSILLEEDSARPPAKRERRPSRKLLDFFCS